MKYRTLTTVEIEFNISVVSYSYVTYITGDGVYPPLPADGRKLQPRFGLGKFIWEV